ncbi:photosystem II protein PsbQ [Spirulina subsalsa]|uniref:photosystem II protein PsbQ n=1 Tax=Spirulina subsalsa TaxID=54311 RepID=UPI0002E65AA5|nr:photosystem II protein PsbQ [Spirulina subsalsa]
MKQLRSILALLLVLMTSFLVACGSGVAKAPPTYTPEKVAEIATYLAPVKAARERMPELGKLIEKKEWNDVDSFIHGPLGDLRASTSAVTRALLTKDQPPAADTAKELFAHFERIDEAAQGRAYKLAVDEYKGAVGDFDAFINLIPTQSDS